MKTETIEKIRALKSCSNGLTSFWPNYKAQTAKSNCDKYHAAFNKDARFSVFEAKIFFSACYGMYGNSSCYTFQNGISETLAKEYFVKAINAMKEDIFQKMSDLMSRDANALTEKADQEIEEIKKLIDSVKVAA